MNKKEIKTKAYIRPEIFVVAIGNDNAFMSVSPAVQPGGGGGGSIVVVPPEEDDEDTELSGAKKFNMWGEWEE